MELLEKINAWIYARPSWCRWIFAILLAVVVFVAGIGFAIFGHSKPAESKPDPAIRKSDASKRDSDRSVDIGVDRVGGLVENDLPAVERNRQAMEKRATDLVGESERLIEEARRGKTSGN